MEKARTIKLCFVRGDGRRYWTTLEHCALGEARFLVHRSLEGANGLYTEAEICIGGAYTETIPRAAAEVEFTTVLADMESLPRSSSPCV
jgi:hypothetical protein